MKKVIDDNVESFAFVVTTVFVKQQTVQAVSEAQALRIAEAQGLLGGGVTLENLSNWHAHKV